MTEPKNDILKKFEICREEYFSILQDDPGLPRELLPYDWLSPGANKVFRKMVKRFRKAKHKAKRILAKKEKKSK